MDKYLIKGETLKAAADAIRQHTIPRIGESFVADPAGKKVCEGLIYSYEVLGNGNCVCAITGGYNYHILIPPEIDGHPVTEIWEGDGGYNSVAFITIPKSVTKIESGAFSACKGLDCILYLGTREEWDRIDKEGKIYRRVLFNSTLNRLRYHKGDDDYIDWTAVSIEYCELTDHIYDYTTGDGGFIRSWRMISYDYLPNNEGKIVPVLYKTKDTKAGINALGEEDPPDIQEPFFYVGTAELDGVVYDKWRKVEFNLLGGSTHRYGWDNEAKIYAYTNRVVVNGKIRPEAFPENIAEVYLAGEEAGHKLGYDDGASAGREVGYQSGYAQCTEDMQDDLQAKYDEGYDAGYAEGGSDLTGKIMEWDMTYSGGSLKVYVANYNSRYTLILFYDLLQFGDLLSSGELEIPPDDSISVELYEDYLNLESGYDFELRTQPRFE